jgi:hypothetical protein
MRVACWSGREAGERGRGLAPSAFPGFRGEPGGGPPGGVGLAGVPGGEDALVADGKQAGEPHGERGESPLRRHQPRAMLVVAGSLMVEKVRSEPVRRA